MGVREAEDLVHEVFLRAYAKMQLFRGGNFIAWLITMTRNVCFNAMARRWALVEVQALNLTSGANEEQARVLEDSVRRLTAALQRLSPEQRICVKLVHLDGCSYEEAAKATGFDVGKVRSHVQNGRRMLRKLLNDGGPQSS